MLLVINRAIADPNFDKSRIENMLLNMYTSVAHSYVDDEGKIDVDMLKIIFKRKFSISIGHNKA